MIVAGSQLNLQAETRSLQLVDHRASVRFWKSEPVPRNPVAPVLARNEVQTLTERTEESGGISPLSLAAMVLERFFGLKVTVITPEDMTETGEEKVPSSLQERSVGGRSLGWGMEVTRHTRTVSEQSLQVNASGRVTTRDGRALSFSLEMLLSRRIEETETLRVTIGDAPVDPLVLQLRPGFSETSDETFAFDLNADGRLENVPILHSGAFFLVNDRNGDGFVQDGSELFGPTTGRGFTELAELDQDGNRWIDEADPVFYSLRLWQPDSEGRGTLVSLMDAGVGALSTEAVSSPWQMNGGFLAESGLYLKEDGGAGHLGEMLLNTTSLEA